MDINLNIDDVFANKILINIRTNLLIMNYIIIGARLIHMNKCHGVTPNLYLSFIYE